MSQPPIEKNVLVTLESLLFHRFQEPHLLKKALSHRSIKVSSPQHLVDNQRLEFLGDRVLGLIVANGLYETYPEDNEGALARRHAALVGRPALVEVANALELGRFLLLSPAEAASGGREVDSILEDACEAVIGALYLDGGLEAALRFVQHYWQPLYDRQFSAKDAKTALQEWAQGQGLPLPVYEIAERSGADHAPHFIMRVTVGKWAASGEGSPKKTAEQNAAAQLLTLVNGS